MSTTDDSIKIVTPDQLTVTEVEEALDGIAELPVDEQAPASTTEQTTASPNGWTNPTLPPPGK